MKIDLTINCWIKDLNFEVFRFNNFRVFLTIIQLYFAWHRFLQWFQLEFRWGNFPGRDRYECIAHAPAFDRG